MKTINERAAALKIKADQEKGGLRMKHDEKMELRRMRIENEKRRLDIAQEKLQIIKDREARKKAKEIEDKKQSRKLKRELIKNSKMLKERVEQNNVDNKSEFFKIEPTELEQKPAEWGNLREVKPWIDFGFKKEGGE